MFGKVAIGNMNWTWVDIDNTTVFCFEWHETHTTIIEVDVTKTKNDITVYSCVVVGFDLKSSLYKETKKLKKGDAGWFEGYSHVTAPFNFNAWHVMKFLEGEKIHDNRWYTK